MLKARIATAVVLLGIFLSALFALPTMLFAVVIAVVVAVGAFEWAGLAKVTGWRGLAYALVCSCLFVAMIWGAQAVDPRRPLVASSYAVSSLFWLIIAPVWLARGRSFGSLATALVVGVVVLVPAGLSIVSMHFMGPGIVLMLLGLVWIADSAAYFAGRKFGRHKLAPSISPGKTWEGAAGAIVGTLIFAVLCALFWVPLNSAVHLHGWVPYLVLAGLLCVVSIEGDLFESFVKRQAGAKDSGTLLPGHGGVLDRIDSITSTLPVAALLFFFIARSV